LPLHTGRKRQGVDRGAGGCGEITGRPELVVEVVVVVIEVQVGHARAGLTASVVLPVAALVPGDSVGTHRHGQCPAVVSSAVHESVHAGEQPRTLRIPPGHDVGGHQVVHQ